MKSLHSCEDRCGTHKYLSFEAEQCWLTIQNVSIEDLTSTLSILKLNSSFQRLVSNCNGLLFLSFRSVN